MKEGGEKAIGPSTGRQWYERASEMRIHGKRISVGSEADWQSRNYCLFSVPPSLRLRVRRACAICESLSCKDNFLSPWAAQSTPRDSHETRDAENFRYIPLLLIQSLTKLFPSRVISNMTIHVAWKWHH